MLIPTRTPSATWRIPAAYAPGLLAAVPPEWKAAAHLRRTQTAAQFSEAAKRARVPRTVITRIIDAGGSEANLAKLQHQPGPWRRRLHP